MSTFRQVAISFLKSINLYSAVTSLLRPEHLSEAERMQRRRMQDFYSQFIKKGDLCFDVGANLGSRTDVFLRLGARVVAVEPQDHAFICLEKKFTRNRRLTLLKRGLSDHIGYVDLHIANVSTISTMAEDWKSAVISSGRFPSDKYNWTQVVTVPVTTLDQLIERYGLPVFIKIDVEGYELPVLRGLSRPVSCLSFEFTPEFMDSTMQCVAHLTTLGEVQFNFCLGESMMFSLPNWVVGDMLCNHLSGLPHGSLFGDVYARFGDA